MKSPPPSPPESSLEGEDFKASRFSPPLQGGTRPSFLRHDEAGSPHLPAMAFVLWVAQRGNFLSMLREGSHRGRGEACSSRPNTSANRTRSSRLLRALPTWTSWAARKGSSVAATPRPPPAIFPDVPLSRAGCPCDGTSWIAGAAANRVARADRFSGNCEATRRSADRADSSGRGHATIPRSHSGKKRPLVAN